MWRKPSSSGVHDCVEVRSDLAAIRDSKNPETTMAVSGRAFARLARFVQVRG